MIKRLILALAALSAVVFTADAKLTVTASASRRRVYQGESFNLSVEVGGADREVGEPSFSLPDGASKRLLGSNSSSRSSISIINGKTERKIFVGKTFTYEITPGAAGIFKTGPITATAGGETASCAGVSVQVQGIEPQNDVLVEVAASSSAVLVEEPFTITLSVKIREPQQPQGIDPVEPVHYSRPPHLSAEFLDIRQPDPAVKTPDLNQILSALVDQTGRQPCFSINEYQDRTPAFDSFFGGGDPFARRPMRFRLELNPEPVERDGIKYREYRLSLDYVPLKEGQLTYGPVTFKGEIISAITSSGAGRLQADTKEIYTIGPAVTVRVTPPPDAGRPDSFIGSVGTNMTATAALDTAECKVGDPLTLTLEVTGGVSISNMRSPELGLQPDLSRDFRIYDDSVSSETISNGRRFKYRVRPLREGTLEFPPVKVSYYDTARKEYVETQTLPIPVQVRATTQIATDDGDGEAFSGELSVEERPKVFGITLAPEGATPGMLLPEPRKFWMLLLIPPVLWLLTVLSGPAVRLFRWLNFRSRRSGALGVALRTLRRNATPAGAAQAVRGYLSVRLGADTAALTPGDAGRLLEERGVDSDTAAKLRRHLEGLDALMYRPDAAPDSGKVGETAALLQELEAQLRRGGSSNAGGTAMLVLLAGLLAAQCAQADEASRRFLWEQANSQMAAAATPEDYQKAAATYRRLVDDGVGNGPLFRNLGTALVMAGDGRQALAAFRAAESFEGESPESEAGVLSALAIINDQPRAELPWYRTVFFWHYLLPCRVQALAALAGWAMLWLGLLLRAVPSLRRHLGSFATLLIVLGVALALVFGSSWTVAALASRLAG